MSVTVSAATAHPRLPFHKGSRPQLSPLLTSADWGSAALLAIAMSAGAYGLGAEEPRASITNKHLDQPQQPQQTFQPPGKQRLLQQSSNSSGSDASAGVFRTAASRMDTPGDRSNQPVKVVARRLQQPADAGTSATSTPFASQSAVQAPLSDDEEPQEEGSFLSGFPRQPRSTRQTRPGGRPVVDSEAVRLFGMDIAAAGLQLPSASHHAPGHSNSAPVMHRPGSVPPPRPARGSSEPTPQAQPEWFLPPGIGHHHRHISDSSAAGGAGRVSGFGSGSHSAFLPPLSSPSAAPTAFQLPGASLPLYGGLPSPNAAVLMSFFQGGAYPGMNAAYFQGPRFPPLCSHPQTQPLPLQHVPSTPSFERSLPFDTDHLLRSSGGGSGGAMPPMGGWGPASRSPLAASFSAPPLHQLSSPADITSAAMQALLQPGSKGPSLTGSGPSTGYNQQLGLMEAAAASAQYNQLAMLQHLGNLAAAPQQLPGSQEDILRSMEMLTQMQQGQMNLQQLASLGNNGLHPALLALQMQQQQQPAVAGQAAQQAPQEPLQAGRDSPEKRAAGADGAATPKRRRRSASGRIRVADIHPKVCARCSTTTTPLWRRKEDQLLCNACGLRRSAQDTRSPQQMCAECGTTSTPTWRRKDSQLYCNACGLRKTRKASPSAQQHAANAAAALAPSAAAALPAPATNPMQPPALQPEAAAPVVAAAAMDVGHEMPQAGLADEGLPDELPEAEA